MASEQGEPGSLPPQIEAWLTAHTAETGDSREAVLTRAVASYRLLAEDEETEDALESTLSELEARIETLETNAETDRLDQLEAELNEHVTDLRSRIVDVVKEARTRAPADHSHDEFDQLDELSESTDELEREVAELQQTVDDGLGDAEAEIDSLSESVETVETKADRLARAVVDLRRRLQRIERHVTHQTALAELLETAAQDGIEKARCDNCGETVRLGLLVEPACPHCRSVFDDVEPGTMFFKSAWLTVADRPALEAGETTEQSFSGSETDTQADADSHTNRAER